MSPGGLPSNIGNLFNIASYLQGQQSLPGSGEGLDMMMGPDNSVLSQQPLGAPAPLSVLGPNTVTSGSYGLLDKSLQPTMNMQPIIDANTPANSGTIGGSGMGMLNQGMGFLEQELAMPENEFDQAQSTITQAKKAANIFARGRDAVQHARNVKKVADVANASSDVGSLLGNLGAQGAGEAAKQTAKTGVGQFIANAGASKMGTFLSSGAGAATSAGVGILGKYIQERDKKDGNYSKAGAMGGGALQGAAIGSALGPIGTVVGAGIGAAVGAAQRKKFIKQEEFDDLVDKTNEKAADAEKDLAKRAVLQTYPTTGIRQQVYAHGGEHDPVPENLAYQRGMSPLADFGARAKTPEELAFNRMHDQGEFRPRPATRLEAFKDAMYKHNMKDDSSFENAAEFFDPTGIASWDDAYRASQSETQGVDQGLDYVGALPLINKFGKGLKVTRTTGPVQASDMAQYYYAPVKRALDRVNRFDAAEDELHLLDGYAYGGHTNNPDYLAEGGEMIQHAPGDLPKTDNNGSVTPVTKTIARINGDKHTAPSGGVGMEGDKSARIYSDQLYVSEELLAELSKL